MADSQPKEPTRNTQPSSESTTDTAVAKKEDVATKKGTNSLPTALQPIQSCFSLPKKAFIAAYADPKEGEVQYAREVNFAAQALMNNPYLLTCAKNNPDDLVNAIKNVALTGATLNPVLKQAYLVPFKGRITLIPSYMGLADILINSGMAKKVEAHPVFEGDEFEMAHGTNGYIKHLPNAWGKKDKENFLGCYFYIKLVDGSELFDALSKAEIEAIKLRSPSVAKGQASPWDTDYIEMAKKTAIRRGFKMCPKTGISEDKLKVVEAAFDYDEKVEDDWIRNQPTHDNDGFDEDEVTYEEICN